MPLATEQLQGFLANVQHACVHLCISSSNEGRLLASLLTAGLDRFRAWLRCSRHRAPTVYREQAARSRTLCAYEPARNECCQDWVQGLTHRAVALTGTDFVGQPRVDILPVSHNLCYIAVCTSMVGALQCERQGERTDWRSAALSFCCCRSRARPEAAG